MKKRLTHFSLMQTSKVMGIFYFILAAVFFIPYAIFMIIQGDKESALALFIAPFFYAIFGYLLVLISLWIYNQVAAYFGGIEFNLEE